MTLRRFAISTIASVMAIAILPYVIFPHPRQKPFDQSEWTRLSNGDSSASGDGSKSKRGAMAEDLIKNHLTRGLSRQKVISMLGNPDSQARAGCPSYYLGWYKSLMDPESLVVCFDDGGKLTETSIWQH